MRIAAWFAVAVVSTGAVQAQTTTSEEPFAVFRQLFPRPTGRNGYEELVKAGELVKSSRILDAAMQPGATLALKRRALADPAIARALMLVKLSASKPLRSPRDGQKLDENTLLPDLALVRAVGRLLVVDQYVLCADGKVSSAIDSLESGLRIGYAIQSETLIGGLVGIAVDSFLVTTMARRLDQLSARDCDRLVQLARTWLRLDDPLIPVYNAERSMTNGILTKYRDDPSGLTGMLKAGYSEPDEIPARVRTIDAFLRANPSETGPTASAAAAIVDRHYAALIEELRKPYWERRIEPPATDNTPSGLLAASLLATPVVDSFVRDRSRVQLLGVHAAIRRYRWEYDRLPDSLDQLKIGPLAIDLFTGQPLRYRRVDEHTYELSSAGPQVRTPEGRSTPARTPLFLPSKP